MHHKAEKMKDFLNVKQDGMQGLSLVKDTFCSCILLCFSCRVNTDLTETFTTTKKGGVKKQGGAAEDEETMGHLQNCGTLSSL